MKLKIITALAVLFAILAALALLATSVRAANESIPTASDVSNWNVVKTMPYSCGPFIFLINPDSSSRYSVGYVHYCQLAGGRLNQYGFWDGEEVREFVRIDDTWTELFRFCLPIDQAIEEIRGRLI